MSQLPIRESRVDRAAESLRGNNGSGLLATAIGPSKLERVEAWRQLRPRDHGCYRVQYVMLCVLHDFFRQLAFARISHVGAELDHHRAHVLRGARPSG